MISGSREGLTIVTHHPYRCSRPLRRRFPGMLRAEVDIAKLLGCLVVILKNVAKPYTTCFRRFLHTEMKTVSTHSFIEVALTLTNPNLRVGKTPKPFMFESGDWEGCATGFTIQPRPIRSGIPGSTLAPSCRTTPRFEPSLGIYELECRKKFVEVPRLVPVGVGGPWTVRGKTPGLLHPERVEPTLLVPQKNKKTRESGW